MKILIAEDEQVSRRILEKVVSAAGYLPVIAEDGDQAWALLQQPDHPRLLLLDWMMPGLTGIEIVQRIRRRADGHSYYVVILTSLDAPEDVVLALKEGADEFISKPYHAVTLQARVDVGSRVVRLHEDLAEKMRQLEDANRAIAQLAATDELTGLYNRRYFNKRLDAAKSSAVRHDFPLSLVLLDIDKFKAVNDNHGHATGDKVLQLFAQTMVAASRVEDVAARWGGEEFILYLAHTPLYGAVAFAERLRQRFTEACEAKTGLQVTVSAGVAQWQPGESLDALFKRADLALYRAKDAGRDRVVADSRC